MTKFEAMGKAAFYKKIKNSADDPAFILAMPGKADDYSMTPEDDWNQGWLRAYYENKEEV